MSARISVLTSKTPKTYFDEIAQLIWLEWGHHYESLTVLENELEQCLKPNNLPLMLYAFLEEEQKVCGCISLLENDLPLYPNLTPWLANFFVSPRYRNQGIGRALYNRLIKEAFANFEYKDIYLYTTNPFPYYSKKWIDVHRFHYLDQLQFCLKLSHKDWLDLTL